jgi:hypothetical protein
MAALEEVAVVLAVNRVGPLGAVVVQAWTTVARSWTGVVRRGPGMEDDMNETITY